MSFVLVGKVHVWGFWAASVPLVMPVAVTGSAQSGAAESKELLGLSPLGSVCSGVRLLCHPVGLTERSFGSALFKMRNVKYGFSFINLSTSHLVYM